MEKISLSQCRSDRTASRTNTGLDRKGWTWRQGLGTLSYVGARMNDDEEQRKESTDVENSGTRISIKERIVKKTKVSRLCDTTTVHSLIMHMLLMHKFQNALEFFSNRGGLRGFGEIDA